MVQWLVGIDVCSNGYISIENIHNDDGMHIVLY
jgi:hypothetical protein